APDALADRMGLLALPCLHAIPKALRDDAQPFIGSDHPLRAWVRDAATTARVRGRTYPFKAVPYHAAGGDFVVQDSQAIPHAARNRGHHPTLRQVAGSLPIGAGRRHTLLVE